MPYHKKRTAIIIKILLFFTAILFNFSPCMGNTIENEVVYLDKNSVNRVSCTKTNCFFPSQSLSDKDIYIAELVNWEMEQNLVLQTKGDIVFKKNGLLISNGKAGVVLKSGMEPGEKDESEYKGTVVFEENFAQVRMVGEGRIKVYYNPDRGKEAHRYLNPSFNYYRGHINAKNISLYMLVNDVYDLQSIGAFLSGSYALSQNIDAYETKDWNEGKGFEPLKDPFSGDFDGNGYFIGGLYINRSDEDYIGLFGKCKGRKRAYNVIENLTLKNFNIAGNHYVGSLAGSAINSDLINIKVINPKIVSLDVAGVLVGTTVNVLVDPVQIIGPINVAAGENKGLVVGGGEETEITIFQDEAMKEARKIYKKYPLFGNTGDNVKGCIISFEGKHGMDEFLEKYSFLKKQDGQIKTCSSLYETKQDVINSQLYDLFNDSSLMVCIFSFDLLCNDRVS